jgi:peptidoglycan hydrolase-like protein with peptidoglycan-binding domain
MKLETIIQFNSVITLDQLKSDPQLVTQIQTNLINIGFLPPRDSRGTSSADGDFGTKTRDALSRFCDAFFLDSMHTGRFGATFAKRLLEVGAESSGGGGSSGSGGGGSSTTNKLAKALEFTLRWEGGKVDHPNDPGGRTNRGITQKVYNSYRSQKGLSQRDVFLSTLEEATDIYKTQYWIPAQAEMMVLPLAIVQFDSAVLLGIGGATKRLQEALNISVDGGFGNQTKNAVQSNNNKNTANKMIDKRIAFHQQRVASNPTQRVFLAGWLNRCNDLKSFISRL